MSTRAFKRMNVGEAVTEGTSRSDVVVCPSFPLPQLSHAASSDC